MKYRIEDDFECTPERFWQVFFDEPFNVALYDHLGIERQLLRLDRSGSDEEPVVEREQILKPSRDLPAIMAKFVKGALEYRERAALRGNIMRVENIPSVLPDKLQSNGIFRVEALGGDSARTNRIWDGELTCSVPLVGKKIEERIVDEVRSDYRRATAFTRTWLTDHPA